MMDLSEQWEREGYVVIRGLFDPDRTAQLRTVCEGVLKQWYACNPETGKPGGGPEATVMRQLNHPGYFAGDADGLRLLLAGVADRGVREVGRAILQGEPMLRCTSLFFNPQANGKDGNWHRDTQFRAADDAEEKKAIAARGGFGSSVQLQVALAPSDDVEYIPGSHNRWDGPEEYHIRKAEGGTYNRSNAMPGAVRIALEPGDAVGFNPAGLHRGRYHTDRLRRTLMLTYTRADAPCSDYFSHQPWMLSPGYLDGLSPDERAFFEVFIAQYRSDWG